MRRLRLRRVRLAQLVAHGGHLYLALFGIDEVVDRLLEVDDLAVRVRVAPRHRVGGGDRQPELLVDLVERPLQLALRLR